MSKYGILKNLAASSLIAASAVAQATPEKANEEKNAASVPAMSHVAHFDSTTFAADIGKGFCNLVFKDGAGGSVFVANDTVVHVAGHSYIFPNDGKPGEELANDRDQTAPEVLESASSIAVGSRETCRALSAQLRAKGFDF